MIIPCICTFVCQIFILENMMFIKIYRYWTVQGVCKNLYITTCSVNVVLDTLLSPYEFPTTLSPLQRVLPPLVVSSKGALDTPFVTDFLTNNLCSSYRKKLFPTIFLFVLIDNDV